VTTLDWIIVAFAALLALRGFRVGFVAGVLSLAGVLAGLYVGSRIASLLLSGGLSPVHGTLIPMFAVLVSAFLGEAIARALGDRLRHPILGTPLELLDRLGGAILGAAVALVLAVNALTPQEQGQVAGGLGPWPVARSRRAPVDATHVEVEEALGGEPPHPVEVRRLLARPCPWHPGSGGLATERGGHQERSHR
jgi:hypothetical protein